MATRRTKKSGVPVDGGEALQSRIAAKAHELFERRGYAHGDDQADWFEAERLVRKEHRSKAAAGRPPAATPKSPARGRTATPRRATTPRRRSATRKSA